MVSLTYHQLPLWFGDGRQRNRVVMNDEMDDFAIAPGPYAHGLVGGEANAVALKDTFEHDAICRYTKKSICVCWWIARRQHNYYNVASTDYQSARL